MTGDRGRTLWRGKTKVLGEVKRTSASLMSERPEEPRRGKRVRTDDLTGRNESGVRERCDTKSPIGVPDTTKVGCGDAVPEGSDGVIREGYVFRTSLIFHPTIR